MDVYGETELDMVRDIVARHFSIYESGYSPEAMAFHCNIFEEEVDAKFEELRLALKKVDYIPMIKKEMGEHVIYVMHKPKVNYKSVKVNIMMLCITCVTTTLAGMLLWSSYKGYESLWMLENVTNGILFFSFPLMATLGVHELGHYFTAKKHNLEASLPFFIPFPPPLGTMGAFISVREPMPNRKALVEIGVAGPYTGLLLAIPISLIGIYLSNTTEHVTSPNSGGMYMIFFPAIFVLINQLMPITGGAMHPMLFAGWVGFFVTALNLLPMGQLDGGHVARALLGNKSKYASYAAAGMMLIFGLIYPGWLFLMFLILFLGFHHPPPLNDITPLGAKQKFMGAFIVVIIILCFVPKPIELIQPVQGFEFESEALDIDYPANATAVFSIKSTGNIETRINLNFERSPELILNGWNASISWNGNVAYLESEVLSITLNESESTNITIRINNVEPAATNRTLIIIGEMENEVSDAMVKKAFLVDVRVG